MSSNTLLRIKNELRTITDLMEFMEVIKQVATSQFHSLQEKRPKLAETGVATMSTMILERFFRLILPDPAIHPFLKQPGGPGRPAAPLGLIIVTSDEGFVGGLNTAVIQKALETPGSECAHLIVVGERGRLHLTDLKKTFTHFSGPGSQIDDRAVEKLSHYVADWYLERKVGRVLVFYPRFQSFTRQEVDSFQLLPYERPLKGSGEMEPRFKETILEPSAYLIVEYLVRLLLAQKIREVFWDSRLSELAARVLHMDISLQTLQDLKKKFQFQYFRSKHEAVDTSIRESYAGLLLAK